MGGPLRNTKKSRWLTPIIIILGLALALSSPRRPKSSSNNHVKSRKQITAQQELASQNLYPPEMRSKNNISVGDSYETDEITATLVKIETQNSTTKINFKIINKTYELAMLDEENFSAYDVFGQTRSLDFSNLTEALGEAHSVKGKESATFYLTADSDAVGFVRFNPTVLSDAPGSGGYAQWVVQPDEKFKEHQKLLKKASDKARTRAAEIAKSKKGVAGLSFPEELFQRTLEDDVFKETGYLEALKGDKKKRLQYIIEFDIEGDLKSFTYNDEKLL